MGILIIHFIINIFSGFYFLFDELSFHNQWVHSLIHLSFFILVIRFLFVEEKFQTLAYIIAGISLAIILGINLIPFTRGLAFHDNGFVPMWELAPQIQYGWPNTIVRVFVSEYQNMGGEIVPNPLVHYNFIFLNLYMISILIFLELAVVSFCLKKLPFK